MGEQDRSKFDLLDEVERLRKQTAELNEEIRQRTEALEDRSVLAVLRRLMEVAPVGFAFLNTECRYELVNQRLAEINGIPVAEHLGRTVEQVIPQFAALARQAFQEVMATGAAIRDVEFSGETAAMPATLRHWSVTWCPVHGSDGRLLGVGVVVAETTRQTRTLEALRLNQERLALSQAAGGIASWDLDLETNEARCSLEWGSLYGLAPTERGPSHAEWLNLIHPDDRPRIRETFKTAFDRGDEVTTEFRVIWPDGSIHWLFCKGRIFRDLQGKAIRSLGVNMDITERKRVEQALLESEERFRSMADSAPMMICVTDQEQRATFFNSSWLSFTGRSMEEELAYGWAEQIHPEDLARTLVSVSAAHGLRHHCLVEHRLRRADGEYRHVLANGIPYFDRDGAFAGYRVYVVDLTDLKRSYDAALSRQKLESIGVLAGGAAHDFNNLLGAILADTELLQSELAGDSTAYEAVVRIQRVANRAAEVVRQLMAYAGQDDAEMEVVDLSKMVGEMLELVRVSISKRIVLNLDLRANLPAVLGNTAQLRQVILNLVVNASEAIGDKEGVMSIKIAPILVGREVMPGLSGGGFIRLEVRDSGCGISPEIQARIFDPFFTTKGAGRGLGLAAVQGIIRRHRGALKLVSALGEGSSFEVLLPCSSTQPVPEGDVQPAIPAGEVTKESATVLIVEDEAALRFPVAKILRKRGFQVVEAEDGRAAVDLFRASESEIDVVLLDMSLPVMSGPEVLQELRKTQPSVKVVLTSAYGEETVMEAIVGPRPWGYIRKPYSPRELADVLWNAAAGHK